MDALAIPFPWLASLAVSRGSRMTVEADALAAQFRLARDGSGPAFRRWVELVTPTVYRLALRLLGSGADAEDVVQETMVRAWQGMAEMKDPQASLAWACRITRNAAYDRGRSRGRGMAGKTAPVDPAVVERVVDPSRDPEALAGDGEARALVRRAMDALPEKHRLVLWLRDVDGMTLAETAAALGVPEGTVDSRLNRARGALGKRIRGMAARKTRWWPW